MNHPHREFGIVGFVLAWVMVGANVPDPLYAVYAARWHFGTATITAIFAVYVAFLIPTLLVGGQWSDQRGRKPVITAGLGLALVGALAFLGAQGAAWLFLARAAQGAGAGLISGAATAHLAELEGPRGRASLVATLATGGGTAIGPLLGGLLAQYGPEPLRLAYLIVVVGLVGGGLAFVLHVRETRSRASETLHWIWPRIPSGIRPIFWLAGGTAFAVWSVTAFFMSLAPSYVTGLLHVSNWAVAGSVVFLMLASASITQLLTRVMDPTVAMSVGLVMIVMAVGGIVLAVPAHALWMVLVSTVVAGVGQGTAFLGSMATVTRIAPSDVKGQVMSSFYVVIYCGVGAPVLGIGLAAQQVGLYDAMLYYWAFIAIVALAVLGGLWARRHWVATLRNP
ncbi:Predicted arabinose efflux permease, MFS family [Sulfobacillus thermosulfidooxidans DSM 9293]|uniref:Predicted arabinose efflux permease, MFS family n=1 Tax=Sulfobacillus thermosulfidooxidans (strain DSM 9293 / VKM B-1269 / AT-1) TaxID=929705 RepID=A0A1W1WIQ4_SULTA|nr:MFS transporter [Sulfobacillus thermosulfidooxidans]SMC05613.1 Predicted arabinose efflux permease, MFS family [Sulfobacillus thermosulfidooxidans DSM 9293]